MTKTRHAYVCQNCGAVTNRWQGRCDACGGWNTIVEETGSSGIGAQAARKSSKGRLIEFHALAGTGADPPRTPTGLPELDRVTGGGFVPGSVILLGGEPGIGKSTLLIQACASLASAGARVAYISGEEAVAQIRMRAERLDLSRAPVELATATKVEDITATLNEGAPFSLVVIDSIQTMWTETIEAAPGTVSQVRGAAQFLIRYAKNTNACVILVGHVTKDGQIAGPRVVEHMVDAVMSFDGDAGHHFRILRALKNRFGPTDEIGVFEMTGRGLAQVSNPSAFFLSGRDATAPGTAVFAGMEGTRPLLVEFQALVAPTSLGTPRRAVVGWDQNRLAMVIAVLETHAGVRLGQHDVYLNVAGGLKIVEPAADLAAAAALVSSITGRILPSDAVFYGEIGLSGAVRPVVHGGARAKEAAKLGFAVAVAPATASDETAGLRVVKTGHVADVVARVAALDDREDRSPSPVASTRAGETARDRNDRTPSFRREAKRSAPLPTADR